MYFEIDHLFWNCVFKGQKKNDRSNFLKHHQSLFFKYFKTNNTCTQKKDLIESKKLFVWNTFFDVKKCFVGMKQNLFDSNKISLDRINICSNQMDFCLKSNKLYLWPYVNAFISLFWRKVNLIQTNIYLIQRCFVRIKQILFHLNKSFSLIQSNLFYECSINYVFKQSYIDNYSSNPSSWVTNKYVKYIPHLLNSERYFSP